MTRALLDQMAGGNGMEDFRVVQHLQPIRHAFRQEMWPNNEVNGSPPPNEFLSLQWRRESDGYESPTILQFELEYIKDHMTDQQQQNLIDCFRHLFQYEHADDSEDEQIEEFCKIISFDIPEFRRTLEVDTLSSPGGSLGGTPPPDPKLPGSPPSTPTRLNIYTIRRA